MRTRTGALCSKRSRFRADLTESLVVAVPADLELKATRIPGEKIIRRQRARVVVEFAVVPRERHAARFHAPVKLAHLVWPVEAVPEMKPSRQLGRRLAGRERLEREQVSPGIPQKNDLVVAE